MKSIAAITVTAMLVMGAGHASAQTAQKSGPSVAVSYADLNLYSDAGRSALEGRIDAAIERVCPSPDLRDLNMRRFIEMCRTSARAGAQQQLAIVYAHRGLAQAAVVVGNANE